LGRLSAPGVAVTPACYLLWCSANTTMLPAGSA
jgi:hypothetical protein